VRTMGFIRKLWRRHKVKAADRRIFMDQGHSSGHALEDARLTTDVTRIQNEIR
jgi:hypothetical protein